jgi:ABC-type xylose transport system permease subunit
MVWIIALAILAFWYWRAKRDHEVLLELKPTGMLRSPLYWGSNALVLVLVALTAYIVHSARQGGVPTFLWILVFLVVVALLVLRRALKWRYPI